MRVILEVATLDQEIVLEMDQIPKRGDALWIQHPVTSVVMVATIGWVVWDYSDREYPKVKLIAREFEVRL